MSQKGKERASALIPYFNEREEVKKYGPIEAIFAQKPVKKKLQHIQGKGRSKRPLHTVEPLAKELKKDVFLYFQKDFKDMVEFIKSQHQWRGKVVLICWESKGIADILQQFGMKKEEIPVHPKEAFDITYILTFSNKEHHHLERLPQRLLYGDSLEIK